MRLNYYQSQYRLALVQLNSNMSEIELKYERSKCEFICKLFKKINIDVNELKLIILQLNPPSY